MFGDGSGDGNNTNAFFGVGLLADVHGGGVGDGRDGRGNGDGDDQRTERWEFHDLFRMNVGSGHERVLLLTGPGLDALLINTLVRARAC